MRKMIVFLFCISAFLAQSTIADTIATIQTKLFKVHVQSLKIATIFPAYPDMNPPFDNKKTIPLAAGKNKTLICLKLAVDNISEAKQSFRIGDIQAMSSDRTLALVAVGLGEQPVVIKQSDLTKALNTIEVVESRKDTPPMSYRFPVYVFEANQGTKSLKLRYKDSDWIDLKE